MNRLHLTVLFGLITLLAFAGDDPRKPGSRQFVVTGPAAAVSVKAGGAANATLKFRVLDGYHVNSNKPYSQLLIPTVVNLTADKTLTLGKLEYPKGHDFTLAVAPDEKLNVYTGEFAVQVPVRIPRATPAGTYTVKGELKYQACNDNSCFPPKTIPVEFQVTVTR